MTNRFLGAGKFLLGLFGFLVPARKTGARTRGRSVRPPSDADAKLEILLGAMPVNVWSTDRELNINFNQGGGLKALGIKPGEHAGLNLKTVLGSNDPAFAPLAASLRALRGESARYEMNWRNRSFETRIEPLRSPDGEVIGTVGLAIDVTERRELDDALKTQNVYFQELFESAPVAIVVLDENDRVLRINSEFTRIFGYGPDEILGRRINDLIVPDELRQEGLDMTMSVASGETLNSESLRRRKDGTTLWVSIVARPFKVGDEPSRVYGMYHDISDRKRAEEELRALSLVDALTGLPNRRAFITLSDQALKWAARIGKEVLLIFIDVDNLKQINDTHGHLAGDRALVDTARVLRETFREADIVARLGGDEFIALITADTEEAGKLVMGRLQARVAAHNQTGDRPYTLGLSIGFTHSKAEGARLLDLMERADASLYEQKRGRA
ncbi:MAG: diguanylate cyclase [Gemmatimonadota bacterium]|nr:diguanylate cyclase [Gemmatimonadota bacterium]